MLTPFLALASIMGTRLGSFLVADRIDSITDRPSPYARTVAEGPKLTIGCSDYGASLFVNVDPEHRLERGSRSDGSRLVTVRFDDRPPFEQIWMVRDGIAGISEWSRVSAFIKSLISSSKVAVRFPSLVQGNTDVVIDSRGSRGAMLRTAALCKSQKLSDLIAETDREAKTAR